MISVLFTVNTFLIIFSAALSWTFVVRYSRFDWRATAEGRHLMAFTSVVGAFTTWASLVRVGLFTSSPEAQVVIGTVLFSLLAYLLFRRNILLHRAQRQARHSGAVTTVKPQFQDEDR